VDEAIAAYQEFVTKYPSIPEAHYNLGLMHTRKQDWPNAEAAFKKTLELKPEHADASVSLLRVYEQSGQKEKAAELAGAAGASNPKIQLEMAVQAFQAGRYDEAIELLKKAEAADPNNAEVQYFLGTVTLNQGKTAEAVAYLEKYLSMNPTNAQNKATAEGLVQALKPKK
jgi:tetratricopeptide (TPR) repeat protein